MGSLFQEIRETERSTFFSLGIIMDKLGMSWKGDGTDPNLIMPLLFCYVTQGCALLRWKQYKRDWPYLTCFTTRNNALSALCRPARDSESKKEEPTQGPLPVCSQRAVLGEWVLFWHLAVVKPSLPWVTPVNSEVLCSTVAPRYGFWGGSVQSRQLCT